MSNTDTAQPRRSEIVRRAIHVYRKHGNPTVEDLITRVNLQLVEHGHETLSQGEITALAFSGLGV